MYWGFIYKWLCFVFSFHFWAGLKFGRFSLFHYLSGGFIKFVVVVLFQTYRFPDLDGEEDNRQGLRGIYNC